MAIIGLIASKLGFSLNFDLLSVAHRAVKIENLNIHLEQRNEIRIKFGSCYGLNDTKNDIFNISH